MGPLILKFLKTCTAFNPQLGVHGGPTSNPPHPEEQFKIWGRQKLQVDFQLCEGVSAPNPIIVQGSLYRIQTSTLFFYSVLNQTCSLKSLLFLLLYWEVGEKQNTSLLTETEKKEKRKELPLLQGQCRKKLDLFGWGFPTISSPHHIGSGGGERKLRQNFFDRRLFSPKTSL